MTAADLIPARFVAQVVDYPPEAGPDGDDWVAALPRLLDGLLADWRLEPVGATLWGRYSVVIPVRDAEAAAHGDAPPSAMLRVSFPRYAGAGDHVALRRWAGRGAASLLRADPHRHALLLERLDHTRDLRPIPADDACRVLGELHARLAIPAPPNLTRLSDRAAVMAETLDSAPDVLPRRFIDQARGLLRELTRSPSLDDTVVHTALTSRKVLAGQRDPWLAISPEALAGEPAYAMAPAIADRPHELGTGLSVRATLRRRLDIVCETAGVDEGRARAWTIVREVLAAISVGHRPAPETSARISLAVAICKAMND